MKWYLASLAVLGCAVSGFGAPLLPTIVGHDFNFGAFNTDGTFECATNGLGADTLIYTQHAVPDHEVTAYWPDWPNPPVYPVFDLANPPGFGGEFVLAVQFTGQDAPVGPYVSLVGTGLYEDQPDLEIYGRIDLGGGDVLSGLLWAIDLEAVSLYGYAAWSAYVLEGVGTIVDGLVAQRYDLIGHVGAMRGHLDFLNAPMGWLPAQYDPLADPRDDEVRAAYSGETGLVPEPAGIALLPAGAGMLRRRR